jgi:hypothetical protein
MILWWALVNRAEALTGGFWITLGVQLLLSGGIVVAARAFSRAIANGTTYAITDRRIVMKFGVIFPMTINVPLRYVQGASARQFADRTGQIAVQAGPEREARMDRALSARSRMAVQQSGAALRGLHDPTKVGEILREAVLAVPSVEESRNG